MIPWEQKQFNAVTHYKICPRCQAKAALAAPYCLVCGRAYHTKFVPTLPLEKDGGGSSPLARGEDEQDAATPTLSRTQLGVEKGAGAEVWMIVLISAAAMLILAAFGSVNQNAFTAAEQQKQEARRQAAAAAAATSPPSFSKTPANPAARP